ncbi:hypothetical protein Tco_0849704 [Tanacetum coccineum]
MDPRKLLKPYLRHIGGPFLRTGPVTTEEKVQRKNDVKARSRLQKIVSKLAILVENILQEDLNLKFLRSLSSEWNTHVVVWRNKPDLDAMSFDDLYNNFKIVEQEVKRIESSSSSSQNMAFMSSPSSTNEVNTAYRVSTANTQVSPASTQVSTASTQVSTANLSDDIVYAFLASQPNGSQSCYEDTLNQTLEDDREESGFGYLVEGCRLGLVTVQGGVLQYCHQDGILLLRNADVSRNQR